MKATVTAVSTLLLLWVSSGPESRTGPVPGIAAAANRVAVLPFRVADTVSGLPDLRDWLQDLLVARLTGEGTPRALSPSDVSDALRRSGISPDDDVSPDASRIIRNALGVR